jgi:hypothetical protein
MLGIKLDKSQQVLELQNLDINFVKLTNSKNYG